MIVFDKVALTLGDQHFAFDCSIRDRSLTMITGASGSGKSTFLNLLAGFEVPDRGQILVNGVDMAGHYPGNRPVSLIFQDHNLFSHLSVFANVGLGIHPSLRLDQNQKQQVSQALDDVGLAGFEQRRPDSLSGGERQRVAFARALVRKKPVIALDEPFAALDPGLRRDMGQLLAELHEREKATVVMVTHNPDDVQALATDVIFLDAGSILFQGSSVDFAATQDNELINRFRDGAVLP